jgi:hypothetical protein
MQAIQPDRAVCGQGKSETTTGELWITSGMTTYPPAIIVHGLRDIRLGLAPALPVTLLSAPGAASYAGVGWWAALLTAADFRGPAFLDCADAPGRAWEGLKLGLPGIVLAPCPAWPQIAEYAAACAAVLLAAAPAALDLAVPGAARQVEPWLAGKICATRPAASARADDTPRPMG